MYIALMSHDNRKDLMVQFCSAYAGILSRHNLCATNTTGRMVTEATGLNVHLFLSGGVGDVVLVAQPGDIQRLRLQRGVVGVHEEEDHVHLVVGDAGADLLAPAVLAAQKQVYVQPRGLCHHAARSVGGAEVAEALYISRLCDQNNIPYASNLATAEMLLLGMDRGDLDWRKIVNPKHKHHLS